MKSFWRKSGGFLAKVWRVSGESLAKVWRKSGGFLAGFDRKEAGSDRNSGRSRFRGVAPLGAARFGHASGCSWPPVKHFGLLEAFCLLEGHASVTL